MAIPWTRSFDSSKHTKLFDRFDVDVEQIETLLLQREKARSKKDFSSADECAKELQVLCIAYHDDSRVWYTKELVDAGAEGEVKVGGKRKDMGESDDNIEDKKKDKRQLRNARQADKNKKNKKKKKSSPEDEDEDTIA